MVKPINAAQNSEMEQLRDNDKKKNPKTIVARMFRRYGRYHDGSVI